MTNAESEVLWKSMGHPSLRLQTATETSKPLIQISDLDPPFITTYEDLWQALPSVWKTRLPLWRNTVTSTLGRAWQV